MNPVILHPAIVAKLQTLTGDGQKLGEVIDVHTDSIAKFPAATVEESDLDNQFKSNADNLRAYTYTIYIHQELKKAGRRKANQILREVVTDVVTAFDTDFNLGGACDYCLPMQAEFKEYTGAHGAVRYAMLTLVCISEVQVFGG